VHLGKAHTRMSSSGPSGRCALRGTMPTCELCAGAGGDGHERGIIAVRSTAVTLGTCT
jgi:hypothetical protein